MKSPDIAIRVERRASFLKRRLLAKLCMAFVLSSCTAPDQSEKESIDLGIQGDEHAEVKGLEDDDSEAQTDSGLDTDSYAADSASDSGNDNTNDTEFNPGSESNQDNGLNDDIDTDINRPAPIIPSPSGPCPALRTGTVNVMGNAVTLWVGKQREDVKGVVYFYWHATGFGPNEAERILGPAIDEIVASGGIVASFTGRPPNLPILPGNTGDGVWYVQDFTIADQILACAVEQLNIDKRRIYTGGTSAGGLQAGVMAINRSSYLAAAMTNSGGILEPLVETGSCPLKWGHPEWVPAMMSVHGGFEDWWFGIEFGPATRDMNLRLRNRGGFVVNCNHGGGHCAAPNDLLRAQWQFQKSHRFGEYPSPFAIGLPPQFPIYCKIFN